MADTHFNTIALLGPPTDHNVAATLRQLAQYLLQQGCRVLVEASAADIPGVVVSKEADFATQSDLLITIGGDGTLLRAARLLTTSSVPVLGINRGRLGFLADITPQEMEPHLERILAGKFLRESRALLHIRLITADGSTKEEFAFNDCVLQKWETGRMLDYETWVDGRYVNTHGGDGVIVSSATGSTAYALSCGGPIIHPGLDAVVIAPISPHTLSDRPIVLSASSTVEIRRAQNRDTCARVTCDGELFGELNFGDRLLIGPAQERLTLLHPQCYDYYAMLRSKLHWGRGGIEKRFAERNDYSGD